ncbi:MAG: heavy metal-associated domain-containing protein [Nakamurella sp.]
MSETAGTELPETSHTVLRAEGFSCPSCVAKIEKQVGRLNGITTVKVHFATSRIVVDHDPNLVTVADIVVAIGKAGYVARPASF